MRSDKKWNKIINYLKILLNNVPSQEEKEETIKAIDKIIQILVDTKQSIFKLPTSNNVEEAKDALTKIEFIFKKNPILQKLLPKSKRVSKISCSTPISQEKVLQEIQELRSLPENEIRDYLKQKKYPKKFLIAILSQFGRKMSTKANKNQIIEQIVTAIITQRTYQGLKGDEE